MSDVFDPCNWAKSAKRENPAGHREMLENSGGKTFEDLCGLVGHTAMAFLIEDVFGNREGSFEPCIITSFLGPDAKEYDDSTIRLEPRFGVRLESGHLSERFLSDLSEIQPPSTEGT